MPVKFTFSEDEIKAIMEAVAHRLEWYRENNPEDDAIVKAFESIMSKVSSATKKSITPFDIRKPVIIVDDVRSMRQVMATILRQSGFNSIIECESGEKAWHALESEKDRVGLVISDWSMEGMSGLDLLKKMKADTMMVNIPFIMVSGLSDLKYIQDAIKSGVTDYIVKPINPTIVLEKIQKHLQ